MNQLDIQNPALYGRGPSELGSVADESLTSCTGPISQDESDFSSFNYNSASMSAGSRNFENNGYFYFRFNNDYYHLIIYIYIYIYIYILPLNLTL